jgi:hypothetical protein
VRTKSAIALVVLFVFSGMIRREHAPQCAATNGDLLLVERVESLAALLAYFHQADLFQFFQVMADRRLVNLAAKSVYHVIHAQPHAAQVLHDFLARIVGHRFGKKNWIDAHILYYIDNYQYVKGYRKSIPSWPPPSRSMAMIF